MGQSVFCSPATRTCTTNAMFTTVIWLSLMASVAVANRCQELDQYKLRLSRGEVQRTKESNFLLDLHEFDGSLIDQFMNDPVHVEKLVSCFETPAQCPSYASLNIICQVQRMGLAGQCSTCNPGQQKKLEDMIYVFLTKFRERYPAHFKRLLPHIPSLLSSIARRS